jgi:hypothetical protein
MNDRIFLPVSHLDRQNLSGGFLAADTPARLTQSGTLAVAQVAKLSSLKQPYAKGCSGRASDNICQMKYGLLQLNSASSMRYVK